MASAYDRIAIQNIRMLQAGGHRRSLKVLTGADAGKSFIGRMEVDTVIDPDMPLGSDLRELSALYVLQPVPAIESQDLIQEGAQRWKVLKRENNTVSVESKFYVVKVVEGKDK